MQLFAQLVMLLFVQRFAQLAPRASVVRLSRIRRVTASVTSVFAYLSLFILRMVCVGACLHGGKVEMKALQFEMDVRPVQKGSVFRSVLRHNNDGPCDLDVRRRLLRPLRHAGLRRWKQIGTHLRCTCRTLLFRGV